MFIWKTAADDSELRRWLRQGWREARSQFSKTNPQDCWRKVKGPIGATIAVLLEIGWEPRLPNLWVNDTKKATAQFDLNEPAEHQVTQEIQGRLQAMMW